MKFITAYTNKPAKRSSKVTDKTKMTIPGLALTNTEHIQKVQMGLPEQAVKLIYDPHDIYPDLKAIDLVDRKTMLQTATRVVNQMRSKGKELMEQAEERKKQDALKKGQEEEARMLALLDKQKIKEGKL